jgi:hypothetical protein
MADTGLRFESVGGLWVARMPTRHGIAEVVLGGSNEKPDERQLAALEPFFARASEITEASRRRLRLAFLYRLIRVAVNDNGKVGLQFRNVLTGSQPLLLADES